MTIREYIDSRDESIRPRLCAVYDTIRGRDLPRAPVGRAAPPAGAAARRVFTQPCGPLRGRRPADRPRVRHPGEEAEALPLPDAYTVPCPGDSIQKGFDFFKKTSYNPQQCVAKA